MFGGEVRVAPQSVHQLLDALHGIARQHIRHLAYVLERRGLTPDGPLTPQDFAALPLAERLFE